ncbi:hypothetical protein KCP77_15750 [Salmonella enterica subsp. enterica]|nr:hypothetical protein KCP77_15750 [Salmonella enterica subsp. enterica]
MCHVYRYGEISVRPAVTVTRTRRVIGDELVIAHYRHHLALAWLRRLLSIMSALQRQKTGFTGAFDDERRRQYRATVPYQLEMRPAITLRITIFCWRQRRPAFSHVFCWAPQYYVVPQQLINRMVKTRRFDRNSWRCR